MEYPCKACVEGKYCTKMCMSWKIWFTVQWNGIRQDAGRIIKRRNARKEKKDEQV